MERKSIKGYELEERIGSGGFGAVYRARQTTINREVAIKIILPGYANQPDFIRRFEAEAHLVARLEHPFIVPLHDYWRDPNGAYLVMRWLRGGSLRDTVDQQAYDPHAAVTLMDQICGALATAHRNQVIHRDIKPGNILLDEDGNAYLADFGIAKDIATLDGSITEPDQMIGSPDYLAPEQARSEPVTPQTDIYSLGVVLFELLAGEHPFPNLTAVERLFKHLNDPLPMLDSLDPTIADRVNEVIQTATQKNPAQRFADVLEMSIALREAVLAGEGSASTSSDPVELLTLREQEVLQCLLDGLDTKQIAEKLYITVTTVRWYLRQIYKKLGVRSRVQAVVRARELNLVLPEHTVVDNVTPVSNVPEPENPYKGLRAFQTADEKDFFGRQKITNKLIQRLADGNRFLAVVGPSGSGKSSLVKAGLIPALWRGDLPGSEKWFVVDMLPDNRPLNKLDVALTRIAAEQAANLFDILQRDEHGLLDAADLILPDDDSDLVLIIDQFEEVFTRLGNEDQRVHFLNLLYTAATSQRSRVRIVITLRADFYDRPLMYPQFGELVRDHTETVLPLTAKELEQAIFNPAKNVGVNFEEGLVATIANEVSYQPGALPLLQYALTELFERREGRLLTHAAYQDVGGTVGALAKRAEALFNDLNPDAQEITRQMFLRMITLGEGVEDTRRRTPRAELSEMTTDEDLLTDIIDLFVEYRLLSLDHDPATRSPSVEVAHEAILREWERLRTWLNESRQDVRLERLLSAAALDWRDHNRQAGYLLHGARLTQFEEWASATTMILTGVERQYLEASIAERERLQSEKQAQIEREAHLEQRSQNFLRGLVAVFFVATLVAVVLALFASDRQAAAEDERDRAEAAEQETQQSAREFRSIALSFGAEQALDDENPAMALALGQEAVNMESPPQQAAEVFRTAVNANWMRKSFFVSDPDAPDAQYMPDGLHIVTVGNNGWAAVWNRNTGDVVHEVTIEDEALQRIGIHPDEDRIVIPTLSDKLYLWTLSSGAVRELGTSAPGATPIFTSDGDTMVTATRGSIHVWDVETWTIERSFAAHPEAIFGPTAIRLSSDESLLVTSAVGGGMAMVWDFETGELLKELDHNEPNAESFAWVWNAQFLNNDEWVITAADFNITLWDWRRNEIIWQVEAPSLVQDISVTPDQQWFVIGLEQIPAQLYHLPTGMWIRSYFGQAGRTRNVKISPDGRYFVTASQVGTVAEWPLWWEDAALLNVIPLAEFHSIAQHPTEPLVALGTGVTKDALNTGQPNSSVYVVNTDTGAVIVELRDHPGNIGSLAFSQDGQFLLVGDYADGTSQSVFMWDWADEALVVEYAGHESWISSLAFSPDGQTLIEGEATVNATILVRDFTSGEIITRIEDQRWVRDVEWSPDGETFYVISETGLVRRDASTWEVIQNYGLAGSSEIEVSANGEWLVVGGFDTTTRVLDSATGDQIFQIDPSEKIALSPDESVLATYRFSDGVVSLWDMETGQRLHRYTAYAPETDAVITFSHDGQRLITTGAYQMIAWDVPTNVIELTSWANENRHIAEFTCEQRELYQIEPLCTSDEE